MKSISTDKKILLLEPLREHDKCVMKDYENGYILATRGHIGEVEPSEIFLFTSDNSKIAIGFGHFPLFRKDNPNEICYISEDLTSIVSHNIKTSEKNII